MLDLQVRAAETQTERKPNLKSILKKFKGKHNLRIFAQMQTCLNIADFCMASGPVV
jgi:hypothetical protein